MDFKKIFKYSWELFVKDIVALIVGGLIIFYIPNLTIILFSYIIKESDSIILSFAFISIIILFWVFTGPLYGGLIKMVIRRIREKRPAKIGDVFSAMDQFGALFISYFIILLLITTILFLVKFISNVLASAREDFISNYCVLFYFEDEYFFLGVILGVFIRFGILIFCIIFTVIVIINLIYVFILLIDKRMGVGEAISASKNLVLRVGLGKHLVMLLILGLISCLLFITIIGGVMVYPFITLVVIVMYFLFNGEEALLAGATGKEVVNLSAPSSFDTYSPKEVVISPVPPSVTPQPNPVASPAVERRSATAVCASCGNKVSTAGAFCTECGAPLKLVCSNCKKELASGARFCPGCGSKIEM